MKQADLSSIQELQNFGNLEMLAQQVVEGFITGLHKSPFHGFSVEFAEHRLYNNGDAIKNIDWKLFGRTDKLFIKRFEEETNLRCQLVVDTSSSMYYPEKEFNKLAFSVYSAASIIYLLKKQRDAFGLSLFSESVELATPARSTSVHQKYVFTELEKLLHNPTRNVKTAVSEALHQIAEQVHKRSMVIIFSDMFDTVSDSHEIAELFAALQHLKYNKHEVLVFNVTDHQHELNFNFPDVPHHFIDMETGDEIKLNPSQARDQYLQVSDHFKKQLELKCAQYKIDMIDADINAGFYPVLQTYLVKRARMA
ncbi:DUF58 domain-containing protein [Pedobacter sp. HMF7647]|uniref:DUF58 domain-containing protein n=1 Tax=Hufsiella arboris TaxID=2695275 RepID=A0A7K1YFK3_9SPHI|nr:DUF58 domain-containing protein [Hufsiella arboris]MXV52749.1 DUF58 domain-containing protein [Hufsiella arboris]